MVTRTNTYLVNLDSLTKKERKEKAWEDCCNEILNMASAARQHHFVEHVESWVVRAPSQEAQRMRCQSVRPPPPQSTRAFISSSSLQEGRQEGRKARSHDTQCPGSFLGIVGQYPIDSKSNRLVTCWHPSSGFLCSLQTYSKDSSKMFGNSRTSTGYFSNSTGSSVTKCQFSPDIGHTYAKLVFMQYLITAYTHHPHARLIARPHILVRATSER